MDCAVCRPTAGSLPCCGNFPWNRIRMVGETTMNRHNGSTPSSPNGVARGMGELTCDIVSLAELQFELFRSDCREGVKRMLFPAAMLLAAGTVAVGTAPIALLLVAELLEQAVGLSRTAAFSITALGGFTAALAVGVLGWFSMRGVVRAFERSSEELGRNVNWIKHALKRPATIESEQLQEG